MSIKRYFSNADTTITNAFKEDLAYRGTGSNMGAADVLEVFQIYAQESSASSELSRVLVQFPVTDIISDRSAGTIPASGSVSWYLKLYNAEHGRTTPKGYTMVVSAVSASWEEGVGLDMENYSDKTYGQLGANWVDRSGSTDWTSEGGDYHSAPTSSVGFTTGREDIEVDVSDIVEQWVADTKSNYGFGIRLHDTYEAASKTYYTKKFFARTSQFFHKRPTIEARWNSSRRDDRNNFYFSSSIAPPSENLNTLYLYNYIHGTLMDIGGDDSNVPDIKLYYSSGSTPEGNARGFKDSSNTTDTSASATRLEEGVYYVKIAATSSIVDSTYPYVVDVWEFDSAEFHTGSAITPRSLATSTFQANTEYLTSITNLKEAYSRDETARFRLYTRLKNWSPNIYTTAVSTPENTIIPSSSYEVCREIDNFKVIPFGTGSLQHTVLSYDINGNYFDLDMSMFEAGYSYKIRVAFYDAGVSSYVQQPYEFKFRVKEDVY
jgi:hypothetical protein